MSIKSSLPALIFLFCCFYTLNHGWYNLAVFWQGFAKKSFFHVNLLISEAETILYTVNSPFGSVPVRCTIGWNRSTVCEDVSQCCRHIWKVQFSLFFLAERLRVYFALGSGENSSFKVQLQISNCLDIWATPEHLICCLSNISVQLLLYA